MKENVDHNYYRMWPNPGESPVKNIVSIQKPVRGAEVVLSGWRDEPSMLPPVVHGRYRGYLDAWSIDWPINGWSGPGSWEDAAFSWWGSIALLSNGEESWADYAGRVMWGSHPALPSPFEGPQGRGGWGGFIDGSVTSAADRRSTYRSTFNMAPIISEPHIQLFCSFALRDHTFT